MRSCKHEALRYCRHVDRHVNGVCATCATNATSTMLCCYTHAASHPASSLRCCSSIGTAQCPPSAVCWVGLDAVVVSLQQELVVLV